MPGAWRAAALVAAWRQTVTAWQFAQLLPFTVASGITHTPRQGDQVGQQVDLNLQLGGGPGGGGQIDDVFLDVRVDVYRSSGPGGQSVNTTDSTARLTPIPTGIVVGCQNEKSQLQNKVSAMRVLQAKLLERKRLEECAELDTLKGDGGSSWGNQMRSYVLHPYQMVKYLRTDYEGQNRAVLDGDIDGFLEAGIRWRNRRDDE